MLVQKGLDIGRETSVGDVETYPVRIRSMKDDKESEVKKAESRAVVE